MPTNSAPTPMPILFWRARTRAGISSRHGSHQVAQKLSTRTFGRHWSSVRGVPSKSRSFVRSSVLVMSPVSRKEIHAPAIAAVDPTAAKTNLRRDSMILLEECAHFRDSGAIHGASCLGRLEGDSFVPRIEQRQLD